MESGAAKPASPARSGDWLALGLLAGHVALIGALRTIAWPELTTPAYLLSRGLLLYRDVKFQHTPGAMSALALAFLLFGTHAAVVRAFAAAGPLLAHVALLRHTRLFRPSVRVTASAFLVLGFCSLDGNAVWPSVLMTALAIPIADKLSAGRVRAGGLLIGIAILLKQTAAFLLLLCALRVAWRRGPRQAGILILAGCLPYAGTVLLFGLLGAAGDLLRWTILVPLTVRPPGLWFETPDFRSLAMLGLAFAPAIAEAMGPDDHQTSSAWLLTVAAGFALVGVPRAGPVQAVAALPTLAVGAARLLQRLAARDRAVAFAFVITLVASQFAIVTAGERFDGRVVFWNDDPALDGLTEELRRLPAGTPLLSTLWENVLPRCGLLPPSRIYVNPLLTWFHPIDDIGERIRRAAEAPGTAIVSYRSPRLSGQRVGPYMIVQR